MQFSGFIFEVNPLLGQFLVLSFDLPFHVADFFSHSSYLPFEIPLLVVKMLGILLDTVEFVVLLLDSCLQFSGFVFEVILLLGLFPHFCQFGFEFDSRSVVGVQIFFNGNQIPIFLSQLGIDLFQTSVPVLQYLSHGGQIPILLSQACRQIFQRRLILFFPLPQVLCFRGYFLVAGGQRLLRRREFVPVLVLGVQAAAQFRHFLQPPVVLIHASGAFGFGGDAFPLNNGQCCVVTLFRSLNAILKGEMEDTESTNSTQTDQDNRGQKRLQHAGSGGFRPSSSSSGRWLVVFVHQESKYGGNNRLVCSPVH
mmetsp:Transcript_982/g.2256  ORF Transcript_982/g.2256 Transcript_982/m.2256 type:complete len:310 (+) Transcript_982:2104-3033(+)